MAEWQARQMRQTQSVCLSICVVHNTIIMSRDLAPTCLLLK